MHLPTGRSSGARCRCSSVHHSAISGGSARTRTHISVLSQDLDIPTKRLRFNRRSRIDWSNRLAAGCAYAASVCWRLSTIEPAARTDRAITARVQGADFGDAAGWAWC